MQPGDKVKFTDKFGNKNLKGVIMRDNQDGTFAVEETSIKLIHYVIPEKDIQVISKNS